MIGCIFSKIVSAGANCWASMCSEERSGMICARLSARSDSPFVLATVPKQLVISGPDSIFENKDFYLHRHIRGRYSAVEKGVFFSPVQDGDAMGKAWDLSRTDFYELDPPQKAKCPPSRGTQISRLREKKFSLEKKM